MTNLTEEQKQIQERAVYGLPLQGPNSGPMTHEQAEFLRNLLVQHDAQNAAQVREFDLNKPPTPPYRYQEYPRLVYRDGKTQLVEDPVDLQRLLADGWSIKPPKHMEQKLGGELSPQDMAEVQRIDAKLHEADAVTELKHEVEELRQQLKDTLAARPAATTPRRVRKYKRGIRKAPQVQPSLEANG
jgi:hypothetical protein